ncbi:MAG: type II toxin-antitoxin system RelE/ParE family toxin [Candidatus Scalindua sp.]|nr:type II toxin-antitoxin system RelE/ParE family toxin [Candidatus Scalindua sp.]
MKIEFIETKEFEKKWKRLKLGEEDLRKLQLFLLNNPDAAPILQGTGGVRKIRWSLGNAGKSGGVRVLYIDFNVDEQIYLLTVFSKNEKIDLSQSERNAIKLFVKHLKEE